MVPALSGATKKKRMTVAVFHILSKPALPVKGGEGEDKQKGCFRG